MDLNDFKKVMDFALEKEEEAVEFYKMCAEIIDRSNMKEVFLELSREEEKHVKMVKNFKPELVDRAKLSIAPNLKISDYLVDMEFSQDMNYQQLLILAMKREEKSKELYDAMAENSTDEKIVTLFKMLAQEELRHKNRIEKEYDDIVLREN
ncbi:ferritin family protein [bacterium]|nr:ferritin family protein [bacterium]